MMCVKCHNEMKTDGKSWLCPNCGFNFLTKNGLDLSTVSDSERSSYRLTPRPATRKDLRCLVDEHTIKTKSSVGKPKSIDLNNTWCRATRENQKALTGLGIEGAPKIYKESHVFIIRNGTLSVHNNLVFLLEPYIKQVKLNSNNEFEYVEEGEKMKEETQSTEEKNPHCPSNFGFEPKEGVEIFKEIDGELFGICVSSTNSIIAMTWSKGQEVRKDGIAYDNYREDIPDYNLTPIKKPWYEDERNINKFVSHNGEVVKMFGTLGSDGEIKVGYSKAHNYFAPLAEIRICREEELLSLLVKE